MDMCLCSDEPKRLNVHPSIKRGVKILTGGRDFWWQDILGRDFRWRDSRWRNRISSLTGCCHHKGVNLSKCDQTSDTLLFIELTCLRQGGVALHVDRISSLETEGGEHSASIEKYNAIFSKPTSDELDGIVLTQSDYGNY
ncbi:hypothetical protein AMECASPLE_034818 [Ameca splendens]|uniref:Uncharacterized protein n=1 Tax=Ameca splendens TaxID=208324 RepID=A0ABV1A3E0_9TELE